jgi:hypothetical protein
LPEHINALCEELLMFDKILLEQDIVDLQLGEELKGIPESAYAERLPTVLLARKGRKKDPNIEFAWQLFTEAEMRSRGKAREKGWTELLINSVFKEKANGRYVSHARHE